MIVLSYPATILTPRAVVALADIMAEHPGDENVELHLFGPEPGKVLRLNVYVDGSPEFLLKAMGLLDST